MKTHPISILITFFILIFSAMTFASTTMFVNDFQFNTENQLTDNFNSKINMFWEENALSGHFIGTDNKKIHTVSIKTGNDKAIVISQGRNESVLKYKEIAFDLNRQGYDIYLIDHRGQGFSERLGGDKYRGHVENFQYYVDDFEHYVASLNLPLNYQKRYLFSHSMGGTISALYLQQFDHPFQAAVFFSPMFSINLGIIPETFAKILTSSCATICSWFNDQPCYIFGGSAYSPTSFADNELTSSKLRFTSSANTFKQHTETQLGSPTMHWVSESISAATQSVANANKISIPILIIKAGADTVVTSEGQDQFFHNATGCKNNKLIAISDAKHEILLERDQYRIPVLNQALQFIQSSQQCEITDIK